MRTIKLMADYHCYPLWETRNDEYGDIAPDSLPISKSLREALTSWQVTYDATLDLDDPSEAGFETQEEVDKFTTSGYELVGRLIEELGSDFDVIHNIHAGLKRKFKLTGGTLPDGIAARPSK